MEEEGLRIPRTHLLLDLLRLLLPTHRSLSSLRRGLDFLTRFAVDTRYPGGSATKRHAQATLRWADRVRADVRTLLGLPVRRRKK